jgi:spermidine synthase
MSSRAASALVLLSSAAVLVLELLAARLLIPYVGNTIETYTAIIGVVLAGIALGTWLGGRAADHREPRRMLAPLLVAGGALAALTVPIVDVLAAGLSGSGPLTTTTLTIIAVLVPAAVLSAVTPVVIKLQLASLEHTGRVVGRLSAISTVGGIAGTFLTGFVLIAYFPTRATIRVLALLLVVGGIVVALLLARDGTERALGRLGADGSTPLLGIAPVVLALLAGGASLATEGPCEDESAYFCIAVLEDPERPSGRLLRLDTLPHSYVDLDDPTLLSFTYTAWYGDALAGTFPDGRPLDALHIGAGGLTMPRWIRVLHPGSTQTVLELDPAVVDVAIDELGFLPGDDVVVVTGDARLSVAALAADSSRHGTLDVVIGDAFGGIAVPWHLTTREFVRELRTLLADDGIYLLNVIDRGERAFLRAELATIAEQFAHVAVIVRGDGDGGNHVIVASGAPLDVDRIATANRGRARVDRIVTGAALIELIGDASVLSDDRAPVDQLLTARAD